MASVEIEKFTGSDGTDYLFRDSSAVHTVDSAMSSTSTNAVQNKVAYDRIRTAELEATGRWGGAFRNSWSPIEQGQRNANCLFGPPAECVSVEYSNDGGNTWIDYGLTEVEKKSLFVSETGNTIACGKNMHVQPGYTGTIPGAVKDLSNDNIQNQRLRITLGCRNLTTRQDQNYWLYCRLRRVFINLTTQSAGRGNTHCVFEGLEGTKWKSGEDTWTSFGDFNIQGDSGWNSIPCKNATVEDSITFGGGWGQATGKYWAIRFTIWANALNPSPDASQTGCLRVLGIKAISDQLWVSAGAMSTMQTDGVPYRVLANGFVRFLTTNVSVGDDNAKTIYYRSGTDVAIADGGTGASTRIGAEYNLLGGVETLDAALDGDRLFPIKNNTVSATNGVFRWYKLSRVWDYIKSKLSGNDVNVGGTSANVTGIVGVANGGTGAATSGDARNALSVYSKSEVDDKIQQASEIGNAKKLYDINGTTNYITGQYSAGDEHNPATFTLSNANGAYVMVDGATFAEHADSADNALQAQEAQTALNADNAVRANSASTADTATTANGLKIRADETITPYILAPVVVDDYIGFGTTMSGKKVRVDSATTSDNTYALQSLTDFNHRWSSPNFDHVNANRAFCRVDVATSAMGDARPVKNDGSKGDGYLLTLNWDGTTTADCQLCIFNGTTNGGQPVIRWHKNDGTWTAWQGLRARGFADQNGTQADFYFSNYSGQKVSPDYSFSTGSQDTPHMLCVIKDDKDNRQIVNVLASKITVQKAKEAAVTTVSSGTVSLAASAYANTGGHWSIVSGATISGGPNTSMALPVLLETILMGSWYSVQRVTDANGDCWTRVVKSNSSRTSWKKLTP